LKGRIIIRSADQQDTEKMLDIYAPYILNSVVSFETDVPLLEEFQHRVRHYQEKLPWLICEINNTLAGYAYATDHRQRKAYEVTKELSVYVHKDYRNLRVGTGLYRALIEILKAQGVYNVLAGITLPNTESVRFHESMGFKPVGVYHNVGYKFGKYHDTGWWELLLGTNNNNALEIVAINEIINSKSWEDAIRAGISEIRIKE
jgi:phosphinothricin acetyltransferase